MNAHPVEGRETPFIYSANPISVAQTGDPFHFFFLILIMLSSPKNFSSSRVVNRLNVQMTPLVTNSI
jgi:hypothetical protein